MYKDLTEVQKAFYDGYDEGYKAGIKAKNAPDSSDYNPALGACNGCIFYPCSENIDCPRGA
jgi:hypothetical protein